jgi:hypothetical protein
VILQKPLQDRGGWPARDVKTLSAVVWFYAYPRCVQIGSRGTTELRTETARILDPPPSSAFTLR